MPGGANRETAAMAKLYRRKKPASSPLSKSAQMARVKKTATAPELVLRRALWTAGLRYRLNRRLPGSPDIVLVGKRIAVFVDGCFWHGCPSHGSIPTRNRAYWAPKIERNRARDQRVDRELREAGWTVLRVWEHEVAVDLEGVVTRIVRIASASAQPAPP